MGTAPPRVTTSYVAISDNILHRMRFPKFLLVVREELGEEVGFLNFVLFALLFVIRIERILSV